MHRLTSSKMQFDNQLSLFSRELSKPHWPPAVLVAPCTET